MQYVICYDVADDRRRTRLSKALLDYGPRIQESVHWAELETELAEQMRARIRNIIDIEDDRVHIIVLCGACSKQMEALGNGDRPEIAPFYVL